MIADRDIAGLCSAIYSEPSTFDKIIETAGVCIGIKEYTDCTAIIGRGSLTVLDWFRDLASIDLKNTDNIGLVPAGFNIGIPETFDALYQFFTDGKPIVMGGHSLGAAHVAQLAGELVARDVAVQKMTLLGCPTPGGERLRYLLRGTAIASYKNLNDPVTTVPFLPSLTPVREFTQLDIQPVKPDYWGILADHHIQYYVAGIHKLFGGKVDEVNSGA